MHLVKLFKKRVHFFRIQAKWVHFVGTLKLRSNTTYSKSEYIFKRFYYEPFKQCNFLSEIAQPYRLLRNMYGAEDRIRTYVGILPTVLQTVPFDHFGTSAWGYYVTFILSTFLLFYFNTQGLSTNLSSRTEWVHSVHPLKLRVHFLKYSRFGYKPFGSKQNEYILLAH